MNKKLLPFLIASGLITGVVFWIYPDATVAKGQKAKFELPKSAVYVSDNVYSLGKAYDRRSDELVEGYAIIHPKNKPAKSGGAKNGPTACYGFLAKDAKWKWLEPWTINPVNTRGLDLNFVFSNLTTDISKWETAASYNILGDGTMTNIALVADTTAPDDQNEVYFADLSDSNTIAVTIVWGIFGGPTFNRKLVEWDMIFDDVTYDWSASGEVAKMDFENIATHELGHAMGLADLYNSTCAEETMYGYAGYGETKKRDLNAGDITGINKLY